MNALPPLGLYVHFPWCVAKCPYCDFNSHSLRGELPATEYVDALIADLRQVAPAVDGRTVTTIFLGGGTPSLFPPEQIDRLLRAVRDCCGLAEDAEITLEANPGAVEHAAFRGYRDAGINRLSLGVQSFADEKLKSLGRIHTAADALSAYAEARAAGFENINLDLMFALPGQTVAEAVADVRQALVLEPEHISHYHLTLEPNTVFYARPPELPDDELSWDIQESATAELRAAGYENYEISAWAQSGRACRHNLNYWYYGDYLGIGAGAHGKLTAADGGRCREVRAAHPREYLQQLAANGAAHRREAIAGADARFEFMLNRLRLNRPIEPAEFEQGTGQSWAALQPALDEARDRGLLATGDGETIRPTRLGWRFLDDLQGVFLPPDPAD